MKAIEAQQAIKAAVQDATGGKGGVPPGLANGAAHGVDGMNGKGAPPLGMNAMNGKGGKPDAWAQWGAQPGPPVQQRATAPAPHGKGWDNSSFDQWGGKGAGASWDQWGGKDQYGSKGGWEAQNGGPGWGAPPPGKGGWGGELLFFIF